MKQFLSVAFGVLAGLVLWEWLKRRGWIPGSGAPAGERPGGGGAVTTSTTSIAPGGDYAALAAAINALAAGVQLPNMLTITETCAAGTTELVAGEGSKRVSVLCFTITGTGTISARFTSGATPTPIWRVDLDAPAGNSGANLATSWPSFLFRAEMGEALQIITTGTAQISVTYWLESA